jgi:diguanylate cyclase (GGDEF)-like protein
LDRSTVAIIARSGGRLVAVLLPLAALAVVRALTGVLPGAPLPWVAPGIAATAALAAGLALLVATAAGLSRGRLRDLADAAALGMLAVTFAVVALGPSGAPGIGVGTTAAAVAFGLGSVAGGHELPTRRSRAIGAVVLLVLVEACLGGILLLATAAPDDRFAPVLLGGAAVLLALAAVTAIDEPARATAIGLASASALAMALAGTAAIEQLVGAVGIAAAATLLGSWIAVDRVLRGPAGLFAPPAEAPAWQFEATPEPEYDEGARLARELRATIEDLIAARRTIELQRGEIERAAALDSLTGVASRPAVLDRLRIEAAAARRYAHPVAVVLLDVDRFAQLNHEYGLETGDKVLREVALRLRLRIREADALGRVGGDAFAAILPHTDEGGAATFARAVLDRLVERRYATDRGEVAVTASIGIALMRPGMTLSEEELLAAAEEALASAKAAGGNRIAFDRLHGLARLDERRGAGASAPDEPAEGHAADR